jgi:hypothetical protein
VKVKADAQTKPAVSSGLEIVTVPRGVLAALTHVMRLR